MNIRFVNRVPAFAVAALSWALVCAPSLAAGDPADKEATAMGTAQVSDKMPDWGRISDGTRDPESISMTTAVFAFLMMVNGAERTEGQSRNMMVAALELEPQDATALRDFARTAIQTYQDYSLQIVNQQCSQLAGRPKTDSNVIAAFVEGERLEEAKQAELVAEIPTVLSPDAYQKLMDTVENKFRQGMQIVHTDYTVAVPAIGAEELADRMCADMPATGP